MPDVNFFDALGSRCKHNVIVQLYRLLRPILMSCDDYNDTEYSLCRLLLFGHSTLRHMCMN
jgi:hypothetical protein